jgi:hypothetical protein
MLCVVGGRPDQGKGLFMSYLAADVSRRGGNVLYSAIEDADDYMTRPRLGAVGANLSRVFLWRFVLPEQMDELAQIVIERDIKLLLIDPFSAHLVGVSKFSDNVRRVLSPLSELMEATDCACVITEHALKRIGPNTHPLNALSGSSSGLPAAARMGYIFGIDPDDDERRLLACVKHNLRDMPPAVAFDLDTEEMDVVGEVPSLVMTEETTFDAKRLLLTNDGVKIGRKPDKRADACEWLTNYLVAAGGPVKAGTLIEDAKMNGHTAKTVRRAAEDMGVIKNPPKGGRSCTWDLPNEVKKLMGVEVSDGD